MSQAFNRYNFNDLPFDPSAFDGLISAIMSRSNFPKNLQTIEEIKAYLTKNPIKVFVFGSFFRGAELIDAIEGQTRVTDVFSGVDAAYDLNSISNFESRRLFPFLELVGVATDDPKQAFISRDKRIWRYPEALPHADRVPNLVSAFNADNRSIPVTYSRVKTDEFSEFAKRTGAEVAFMGTFGQLIDQERIDLFKGGFFNCHPVGNLQWPHIVDSGPQPFEEMIERGEPRCWMMMHRVNEKFDDGALVSLSSFVRVASDTTPVEMHQSSSPLVREAMKMYFDNMFYRFQLHIQAGGELKSSLNRHAPGLYQRI